ncbi:acyltransferase family protein [Promicromonospora sp. NPDC052451]|uniref:acyltransferase family protein n=1 Tax=Promicromonospora sp. NPDC052451 TaxID=3364407 RepID=UPI0037CCBA13
MNTTATETRPGPAPLPAPAPPAASSTRTFLPEVQALRALAVLLVVANHLRPDLMPGGYVGVDVFFVISGFLITGHMVKEVRATGRLRLGHFWANRARRILPASLLAILAVVVTAPFVLPLAELRALGRQALGSIFYVQNWILAADSVDYSASENAATPFQHFWSLAVEEQFYLLWPLVVTLAALAATRIARRRGSAPLAACLTVAFALVIIPSFVWSVVLVGQGDPSAYFVTTTRLWELGVGGVLAVLLRYTDRLRLPRALLALAGLGAIAWSAFALTAASPFPGANALLPVLGTAAVIAAGRTSGVGSLSWLVDLRPVQWVGNVSYSLYLWHFPVAIYFVAWAGRHANKFEVIALLAVMFALSWASYNWVEQPFRKAAWARKSDARALVAALVAMLLVAGSASVFWIKPATQEQEWDQGAAAVEQARAAGNDRFGAGATRDGSYAPFITDQPAILPNPGAADKPLWLVDSKDCDQDRPEDDTAMCEYGHPDSQTVIAVVGDSHARMFAQPIIQAAETNGWKVVTFLRNSCPFSFTPRTIPGADDCVAANERTLEKITRLQPDAVVSAYYEGSEFQADGEGRHGRTGLAAAYDALAGTGARVFAMKDTPLPREDVFACVGSHYSDPGACAVPRAEAFAGRGLTEEAAEAAAADVTVVDLTDRFCDETTCPAVLGGVSVYADLNHISDVYGPTLAPDFARVLAPVAGS